MAKKRGWAFKRGRTALVKGKTSLSKKNDEKSPSAEKSEGAKGKGEKENLLLDFEEITSKPVKRINDKNVSLEDALENSVIDNKNSVINSFFNQRQDNYIGIAALYVDIAINDRSKGYIYTYAIGYERQSEQEDEKDEVAKRVFYQEDAESAERRIEKKIEEEVKEAKLNHLFGVSYLDFGEDEIDKFWKLLNQSRTWLFYDMFSN